MSDEIYIIIGKITSLGLIGIASFFTVYWLMIIGYGLYKRVRNSNFVAYHIFREVVETPKLMKIYRELRNEKYSFSEFNIESMKYGRYMAKYRLRNIKATRVI